MSSEGDREGEAARGSERFSSPAPTGPADPMERELRLNRDEQRYLLQRYEDLAGHVQRLSAQLGEQSVHVRSLKEQLAAHAAGLKHLEREYGLFQQRVNRQNIDKTAAVEGLIARMDGVEFKGTAYSQLRQLLGELRTTLHADVQRDLTSMETKLATAGVQSNKAASEEEEQEADAGETEEGEASDQAAQPAQDVPVQQQQQQQPSASQPVPPKQFAEKKGKQGSGRHGGGGGRDGGRSGRGGGRDGGRSGKGGNASKRQRQDQSSAGAAADPDYQKYLAFKRMTEGN